VPRGWLAALVVGGLIGSMRRYDGAACGYLLLALRDPAGFCPLGRGRCPQESAPEGNAGGLPVSRPQGHAPDSPHWQLGFWRPCWRDAFKASERQQAPTVRQVHPAPTPLSPPPPGGAGGDERGGFEIRCGARATLGSASHPSSPSASSALALIGPPDAAGKPSGKSQAPLYPYNNLLPVAAPRA
jgi:hypothetical protein